MTRIRTIIRYDAVKLPARKKFICVVCGQSGVRSKTFRQTISPFNKNSAGQIKTYGEIWHELKCAAAAWEPDKHARCE